MPAASGNRIAELDPRMSCAEMVAVLRQKNFGVRSGGAALALWRACSDRGLRAWCYEFGFPDSLTHTVTIVEIGGALQVHDPFFNMRFPLGFPEMLAALRGEHAVGPRRRARDRKIYLADPAWEPEATLRWLEANADRELAPADGLRRFELLWDPEAFAATHPGIDTVFCDLAAHGYPADLQFLMLHPLNVFDGQDHHRDRASMPLVSGLDLQSPAAALHVAARDLVAERANAADQAVRIARLEADLAQANSRAAQLAAERDEADREFAAHREALARDKAGLETALNDIARHFSAERHSWLQQKVALQAGQNALEGELAKAQSQFAAAVDLRAQRDSRVAQLRAEIEDAAQRLDVQRDAVATLEGERREWESARVLLESENRDLQARAEARSNELDRLRQPTALLESRVAALEEQAIEITHCFAPLLAEMDQLKRDNRAVALQRQALCREKSGLEAEVSELTSRITEAVTRAAALEAEIAAAPGARLRSLWRRFATKRQLLCRAARCFTAVGGDEAKMTDVTGGRA
jgi:hypothetical protein